MKTTLALCLMLTGCATTTVYDRAGRPAFSTQADIAGLRYRSPDGSVIEADSVNHSRATIAGGQSAAIIGSGVAKAAVGISTALATPRLP